MENDRTPPFFRRNTNYDWNSTIMVAALISLSFVVVLITILYIYAKCLIRRQARRQADLHHISIITASATEPTRRGLDPSVIASLPKFVTKKTSSDNIDGLASMECSVCLSILEDGEIGRSLPNCKHTFHAECVDKWFVSNSTCPVCRAEAEPRESVAVVVEAPLSATSTEGTTTTALNCDGNLPSPKVSGSTSRLSSFKRILSRERSSKSMQTQSCAQEDVGISDIERQ